ncbi:hopanoid biosynthesis associated radical SAM protein HpnJ [Mycobacteroides abscessus subsp. abscessus]|nr:hopanoid biosynthesis associated radical SAM protein HpnJ [Mycobacteroides abscessus subsp. abscessus]
MTLINLNSLPTMDFHPVFPIGAVYVKSYVKQLGVDIELIDFKENPEEYLNLSFLNSHIDCLAFSIRNVDSMELNSKYYLKYYKDFMDKIIPIAKKRNPNMRTLIGGGGYAVYSEGLKKYLPFQYGIKGNIEEEIFDFLSDHIQSLGEDIRLIPNHSLFSLDFTNSLVQTYKDIGVKQIGLPTRCGGRCPMKCVYCSYGKIDNKTNITRPLKLLKEDILNLYDMGIREIFFTDSLFNINLDHSKSICNLLIDLNLDGFRWSAYAKPTVNEEFVALAAQSGCKELMVSFDTFSPSMLIKLKKGFNLNIAKTFIDNCRKYNVTLLGMLLFGGPEENEESIKETCKFTNENFKKGEIFFSFGMRVLPGSQLAILSGIPEKEMITPLFWPFDESCFDYAIKHFDAQFLKYTTLGRISNWRKAYREMREYSYPGTNSFVLQGKNQILG